MIQNEVEITGLVEDVSVHIEETGFTVLELENDGEYVTVVGVLPEVAVGERLTVRGEFATHPVYGQQIKARSFTRSLPSSAEDLYKYLAAGTIKAFAEMALGISLFHLYDHLRRKKLSPVWEVVLTLLMLFSIYRYFALTIKINTGMDNFRRIVYIMIIVLLSFLNKDVITGILNNGFSRALGKISMTMYVCHFTLCNIFFNVVSTLWRKNPMSTFLAELAGSSGGFGGGWGGMTINWKVRVFYILFVVACSLVLHLIASLLRKLCTPRHKSDPPAPAQVPEAADSAAK